MKNKTKRIITLGTESDFFSNAHKIMQNIDNKQPIEPAHIITFGYPVDMIKFITPKKLEVINLIKKNPSKTITEIAAALSRNRSSVSREINSMADVGIVKINSVSNPGHGKAKVVNLTHECFLLQARF